MKTTTTVVRLTDAEVATLRQVLNAYAVELNHGADFRKSVERIDYRVAHAHSGAEACAELSGTYKMAHRHMVSALCALEEAAKAEQLTDLDNLSAYLTGVVEQAYTGLQFVKARTETVMRAMANYKAYSKKAG